MTSDHKVRDEKLHYDINREAAKISALPLGKIDKYEYLICEKMPLSNQRKIIELVFPLGKTLGKQTEKQVGCLKSLDLSNKKNEIESIFPQNLMNDLIRVKLTEFVNLQDIIRKDDLNINQNVEKLIVLVNIHYLFLNRYI